MGVSKTPAPSGAPGLTTGQSDPSAEETTLRPSSLIPPRPVAPPQAMSSSPVAPPHAPQFSTGATPFVPPPMAPMQAGPPPAGFPAYPSMPSPPPATAWKRAFAGYGTLISHRSWLLVDQGAQAEQARKSIQEHFSLRSPHQWQVTTVELIDPGKSRERRSYLHVVHARSRSAHALISVNPLGRDLYISRSITVRPPISPARVALAATFGVAFLLPLLIYLLAFSQPVPLVTPGVLALAGLLATVSFPSLAALVFGGVYSLVTLLSEDDPLQPLRYNSLTEFLTDSAIELELASDLAIREATCALGAMVEVISSSSSDYRPGRRLRPLAL